MWQAIGVVVSPLKYAIFWVQARLHRSVRPRVAMICGTELFIIRNWGDREWSLPGGGLHRGEAPEQGAVRECREEIGVSIPVGDLRYVTTLRCKWYDAPLYVWRTDEKPLLKLQKLEITGSMWVTRGGLPPLESGLHDAVMELDF